MMSLGEYMSVQCHACIGGKSIGEDIRRLDHGVSTTTQMNKEKDTPLCLFSGRFSLIEIGKMSKSVVHHQVKGGKRQCGEFELV